MHDAYCVSTREAPLRVAHDDWERMKNDQEKNLKREVNNFLWNHLPGGASINQGDELAVKLYGDIMALWDSCEPGKEAKP